MREIAILGIGQTPVSENFEQSIREIAGEAVFSALLDADVEKADGLFVTCLSISKQENLGIAAD
jgi:acetyl-CoA C-acetyltransferase